MWRLYSLLALWPTVTLAHLPLHKETIAAPLDPQQVEEGRQVVLSNSLPWPNLESDPRGFALCFQTGSGLQGPTIWQRWLEEAFDWIHKSGLEDPEVKPENSKILRTFVHHAAIVKGEAVKAVLPPLMKESVVPNPGACRWGPTNGCTYRLLEYAYESCQDCGYFFLVSDNSLPLLRFQDMYEAFLADQRMRARLTFPVYMWAYGTYVTKASLWKGMPRPVVGVLVENKEEWVPGIWLKSDYHEKTLAAPDEWQVFLPLIRRYGEALFDIMDDGSSFSPDPKFDRTVWVKDCWETAQCPNSDWSGNHFPLMITAFDQGFLDELFADPHMWFFRKCSDQTTVKLTGGGTALVYDYMTEHLLKYDTKTVVNTTTLHLPDSRVKESWVAFVQDAIDMNPKPDYLVDDLEALKSVFEDDKGDRQY